VTHNVAIHCVSCHLRHSLLRVPFYRSRVSVQLQPCSGFLHHVSSFVHTDISDECTGFIFRVPELVQMCI
jgi:hypothetical protein